MKLIPRYMTPVAASLLLLASCTNEVSFDYEGESSYNTQEVDVTFSVSADDLAIPTRASQYGVGVHQGIGAGSKIDMLIYAVYMDDQTTETVIDDSQSTGSENNGDQSTDSDKETKYKTVLKHKYVMMTQYGNGDIDANGNALSGITSPDGKNFEDKETGKGQTVVHFDNGFPANGYNITLRLQKGKTYTVVFWAQSSETYAYNTNNLRMVRVRYNEKDFKDDLGDTQEYLDYHLNNDEFRDAFCKSESFSVNPSNTVREVKLRRPFAQINVATTGADYKHIGTGSNVFTNQHYLYSKIELDGVAQFFDLVTDKVLTDDDLRTYANAPVEQNSDANAKSFNEYDLTQEKIDKFQAALSRRGSMALTSVEFEWNKIPAYWDRNIPSATDDLIGSDEGSDKTNWTEEFLLVNLDDHNTNKNNTNGSTNTLRHDNKGNSEGFLKYLTNYPTANFNSEGKIEEFLTETFKYLSMCYVLVPSYKTYSTTQMVDDDDNPVYDKNGNPVMQNEYDFASSVLKSLKVSFVEDVNAGKDINSRDFSMVPVRRNWRTNILGGFATSADEAVSTSIFNLGGVTVSLDKTLDGDYYQEVDSNSN